MSRAVLFRILVVSAVSVALTATPHSAFAQRGGHGGGGFHSGGGFNGGGGFHGGGFHSGGGGGFHGGGGFGGFRGSGGNFNGFRGGNFDGFRGGNFGGFRNRGFDGFHRHHFGGFRGYPGYGYGFFDFGFFPYWGYPYWYGYGPWWGSYSYYDPYGPYDPDDRDDSPYYRRHRDNRDRCDYRYEDTCKPNGENRPAKPSNSRVPEGSPDPNYVTTNLADQRSELSLADNRSAVISDPIVATTVVASNYQPGDSPQLPSGLRPAVENVAQALRAMPPAARERQLNSGRYDSLSPEEREFLTNATQAPQAELAR